MRLAGLSRVVCPESHIKQGIRLHVGKYSAPHFQRMDEPKRVSPLRQLADIISASVTQIDAVFDKAGVEYPSLDAPFDPTSPSEQLFMAPEVIQASVLAVAACAQLGAAVKIPALTLYDIVGGVRWSLVDSVVPG